VRIRSIVLASHGTAGARAAEQAAFELARREGATVAHLYVVPDFWAGMRGDDWLNNAATQEAFGDYLENELADEAQRVIQRLREEAAEAGIPLVSRAMFGDPTRCLLRICQAREPDLAILGTPRPRGVPGYRSRMKLETLVQSLSIPLMIVPHDADGSGHSD